MSAAALKPIGIPEPKWEAGKRAVFLLGLREFRSAFKRIKFHDGVVLRQAQPGELTYGGPKGLLYDFGVGVEENPADYLIELSLKSSKFGETSTLASIWLDDLITSLRLLKPAQVRVAQVYVYQPDVPGSRHSVWWSYKDDRAELLSKEYILSRTDLYTLRKIYRGINQLLVSKDLGPFWRFETGRSRLHGRDRLIDYWIALESLFSGEDETQELAYKYAIRIGHYIGGKQSDKFDMFKRMKQAYRVRSKVVHGTKAKGLEQAETSTETALRESLRRAALDVRLPDLEELDRLAASGR